MTKENKFGWFTAAFFIVSEMAGSGIVTLPKQIKDATLTIGITLIIFFALLATITAILLSKSWLIVLNYYPFLKTQCRNPYSEIGNVACGRKMKFLVTFSIFLTHFGASVCFIILIAKNILNICKLDMNNIDSIIIIVGFLILPFLMFKSPINLCFIIMLASISTLIAVGLILYGYYNDRNLENSPNQEIKVNKILIAIGSILFTYGGHGAFPTIIHDMKKSSHFFYSSVLAFAVVAGLNCIVSFFGAKIYGESLKPYINETIQNYNINNLISIMITLHCVLALPLVINPVNQGVEEFSNISHEFGIGRIICRSIILVAAVVIALLIPIFHQILPIIGSSFITLTSLTFPPIFFLFLKAKEKQHLLKKAMFNDNNISFLQVIKENNITTVLLCLTISGASIIVGIIATYCAIEDIYSTLINKYVH